VDLKGERSCGLCVFCICDFPEVDLMTLVCSLKSLYEFWELNFVVESMLLFCNS